MQWKYWMLPLYIWQEQDSNWTVFTIYRWFVDKHAESNILVYGAFVKHDITTYLLELRSLRQISVVYSFTPVSSYDNTDESSRWYEQFCNYFLKGNIRNLHGIIDIATRNILTQIDIQKLNLTQETFTSFFKDICRELFRVRPGRNGSWGFHKKQTSNTCCIVLSIKSIY